jgi:hypothetical protein
MAPTVFVGAIFLSGAISALIASSFETHRFAMLLRMRSENPHGEERVFARLRTMLRIAGRTMRPR